MYVTDTMEQYVLFKQDHYSQLTLVQHHELKNLLNITKLSKYHILYIFAVQQIISDLAI